MMLGNYRILDTINGGGFGTVKHAECAKTGACYAIKVMPHRFGSRDRMREIRNEVMIHAMVSGCSNRIVGFVEAFQDGDNSYIVMEKCGTQNVDAWAKHSGLGLRECRLVTKNMLMGLSALHKRGVLHGDIKPLNVLLNGKRAAAWKAKLCDFGLAQDKMTDTNGGFKKQGTPWYAAPEVFVSEYGLAADMWSVGVCMYSMVYGRHPFENKKDLNGNKMLERMVVEPVVVPEICGPLFVGFVDLVKMCLTVDPSERIPSLDALDHPFFKQIV